MLHLVVLWVLYDGSFQEQDGCVQVSLSSLLLTLSEGVGPVSVRVVGAEEVALEKTTLDHQHPLTSPGFEHNVVMLQTRKVHV